MAGKLLRKVSKKGQAAKAKIKKGIKKTINRVDKELADFKKLRRKMRLRQK